MDISQFESSTNNALLQIQRAQRVLDETEQKMKRFKKQKEAASKLSSNLQYRATPLPNIKQYLSYLIDDNQQLQHQLISESKNTKKIPTSTEARNNSFSSNINFDNDLQNIKKTAKAERINTIQNPLDDKTLHYQNINFLNLQKHTQQQLEKSQLARLQRLEGMYKQQFQILDNKVNQLHKNRDKIKKDKVLLMRDNEQLQQKIADLRTKKKLQGEISNENTVVDDLRSQITKLQKKLSKIQMENNRIIKKKQQLQANMRVCIKNNKQQIEGQLIGIRKNKSKSMINYKCPYH